MQKKHKFKLFLISFLLIAISPGGTNAMASFNPFKACTFSEMKIKLTLNGEPVSGAKITRSIQWQKEWIDTFTSDEDGIAVLPAKFSNSLTQVLPVEFVVSQAIDVSYENKNYEVWVYAKRSPGENSEMGKPLNLTCELTDETRLEEIFDSALLTSCQFN
ncbi:hypothetical protein QT397_04810 [Microbulbifer sp. MKSA007]|uniref:DUF6795 domain-containing protein n=1 Tax=Microbulbifer sp. TRSA007 TaxID=3243384 RepID=UPI002B32048F|nr:hypothetical protein QT397_04810 [Microbulbifer sp. MKSA007]